MSEVPGDLVEALGLPLPSARFDALPPSTFPVGRLSTSGGRFLVKRLWAGSDPKWSAERARGMQRELDLVASGLPVPRPLLPPRPAFGFAVRVGPEVWHAHHWVEHRAWRESDDVSEWLGRTLATVHAVEPEVETREPRWWGLETEDVWDAWIHEAERRGRVWSGPVRDALPGVLRLTDRLRRLRRLWWRAGDHVLTHGDVEPQNVLMSAAGPVLADWDSTGVESATLEVAHAAVDFSGGSPERGERVFRAYRNEGGVLADLGEDLFLRRAAMALSRLTERVRGSLDDSLAPAWVDRTTAEQAIVERVGRLPRLVAELTAWARQVDP